MVHTCISFLLQRKHPKIYEETQKSGTEAKVTGEQTTVDSFISTRKYAQNDPRQCRAVDALTSLVADNMLPLSIVESPSFRNYCHSLDQRFVVPSRKHLSTTLLTKKHEAIRIKLRDVLAEAEGVSLTLDLWSNQLMKGFLGITCHFILNWSMYSLMLALQRASHSREHLRLLL